MKTLTIPYDESMLSLTGQSPEEFEQEARFLLALKLFELGRISIGKASEFSGMNKLDFLSKVSAMNIPVVDWDEDQFAQEFNYK